MPTIDFEEIARAEVKIRSYRQRINELLQAQNEEDVSDDENDALQRQIDQLRQLIRVEQQYIQDLMKGQELVGGRLFEANLPKYKAASDYLQFLNGEPDLEDKYVVEKVGGALKPLICRQGNKFLLRDKIIPKLPPHKRYVELFAGSAAIFFNKEKAEESILNDLDKNTYNSLQLMKKAPTDPSKYTMDISTIDKTKQFYAKHINTKNPPATQLVLNKLVACTGFSGKPVPSVKGIYKTFGMDKFVNSLPTYKEKLKGVTILNQDYAKVVDKYNTADTFFFLDPPYENTNVSFKYAEDKGFDFYRLAETLRKIKGKFFMTINDSKNIRTIFKGFYIKPIDVYNAWGSVPGTKQTSIRKELFITNYKI
jgi:DNA adenine methylase